MSPLEIFRALNFDDPRRKAAERELYALVRQRAALRDEANDRDDLVQEVAAVLLKKGEIELDHAIDGAAVRYVDTCLKRAAIDAHRSGRLTQTIDDDDDIGAVVGDVDSRAALAEAKTAFDRLAAVVIEQRRPRDRPGAERTRKQIEALQFEGAAFDDILASDEGVGANASAEDRRKARQRVLQQHTTFRRQMAAAVDETSRRHALDDDEIVDLRRSLTLVLYRCHRSEGRVVDRLDGPMPRVAAEESES